MNSTRSTADLDDGRGALGFLELSVRPVESRIRRAAEIIDCILAEGIGCDRLSEEEWRPMLEQAARLLVGDAEPVAAAVQDATPYTLDSEAEAEPRNIELEMAKHTAAMFDAIFAIGEKPSQPSTLNSQPCSSCNGTRTVLIHPREGSEYYVPCPVCCPEPAEKELAAA